MAPRFALTTIKMLPTINYLISVPFSQKAFNKEANVIKYLAQRNHIMVNIDGVIHKKLVQKAQDTATTLPCEIKKDEKWICVPYLGNFSLELNRLLKSCNFLTFLFSILFFAHPK